MVQIIIFFIAGTALLVSATIIFSRWLSGAIPLILALAIVSAINIFSGSESLHIFSAIFIIGASAGYTFNKNKSIQFYLTLTSLVLTAAFSMNYYYLKNYKNIDIISESRDTFTEIVGESSNISEKEKEELFQKIDESLILIREVIPFSYFLNSVFMSLFAFFFLRVLFLRQNPELMEKIAGIENFKIKDQFIFLLIGGWLTVLLIDSGEYNILYTMGLNTALILSIFYVIQAFGIIKYFLVKKGLPTIILPVSIFIILLIGIEYSLFFMIMLSGFGALDFWADFRKLNEKNSADKTEDKKG